MFMKKGLTIALILVCATVLAVVLMNVTNVTGNATITPNANYGPVEDTGKAYHSCSYLTDNDGWDVTKTRAVKYFDRLSGMSKEVVDNCETDTKVREYNCLNEFMVYRPVICPSRMVCKDGSCVYA